MRKILIVTGWLDVSGTETFIMNVLRALDKSRFHVDFLLFNRKETAYSREAESLGSTLFYLPARKNGFVKYHKALNTFFSETGHDYDVIHYCGGSLTSIAPMYYAKKYGIKTIIAHAHSTSNDGFHNYILHKINKIRGLKIFTHRWGCSTESCRFFFDNKSAKIIKNGVDLNKFRFNSTKRTEIRASLGISEKSTVIGHIGRFVKLKNQGFIVDVFNDIIALKSDCYLVFVGIGPEQESVRNKVKELNLHDRVIFTNERQDIPELLWSMDCLVMPSIYEGLPFVLVEAQASDLNCVVSDVVSNDCKISQGVYFMNLNDSSIKWASKILSESIFSHNRNLHDDVRRHGYDINETVAYIESVYSGEL